MIACVVLMRSGITTGTLLLGFCPRENLALSLSHLKFRSLVIPGCQLEDREWRRAGTRGDYASLRAFRRMTFPVLPSWLNMSYHQRLDMV